MNYEIVWTARAGRDLDLIHSFICRIFSQRIADVSLAAIVSRVEQLREFPLSGKREAGIPKGKKPYYFVLKGNSRIVYRIQNNSILIVRVFDVRQNPAKLYLYD